MSPNDPQRTLGAIVKFQERLKQKPKRRFEFLNDSAKVISISAFIVSMVTTIHTWRRDDLQAREAVRREFNATMQQLIDIGLKNFEFATKNKNAPNLGAVAGWFNAQSGLMGNKAFQELAALDDASMFDYILVGNTLFSAGQPERASALYRKAIDIGQRRNKEHDDLLYGAIAKIDNAIFGEKLDLSLSNEQRTHDLASAYTSLGQSLYSEKKNGDAVKAYEAAIQVYTGSSQNEDVKRNAVSFIHKFWAEAVVNVDCRASLSHLATAVQYFPDSKKIAEDADWNSLQYELSWGSSHCGADGRLHGDSAATSAVETYAGNLPSTSPPWPSASDSVAGPMTSGPQKAR